MFEKWFYPRIFPLFDRFSRKPTKQSRFMHQRAFWNLNDQFLTQLNTICIFNISMQSQFFMFRYQNFQVFLYKYYFSFLRRQQRMMHWKISRFLFKEYFFMCKENRLFQFHGFLIFRPIILCSLLKTEDERKKIGKKLIEDFKRFLLHFMPY